MSILVGAGPPSVFLPPPKQLRSCSDQELANAITRLRDIYLPEVRGSIRQHSRSSRRINPHNQSLDVIRADTFERSFTIQWLTRFVSAFSEVSDNSQLHGAAKASFNVLEEAASLLAICAGAAASGTLTRTFTFPLSNSTAQLASNAKFKAHFTAHNSSGDMSLVQEEEATDEIKVIIRDAPLESADVTSVGAQTWGGSCILAEMIAENPKNFGVSPNITSDQQSSHHMTRPFRALELGAGTGLVSLVLGKVLTQLRSEDRQVNQSTLSTSFLDRDVIVATDFHPTVLANLRENVSVNFPSQDTSDLQNNLTPSSQTILSGPHVIVQPLDWSMVHNDAEYHAHHKLAGNGTNSQSPTVPSLSSCNASPLDRPFDLIIGTDIIYENLHARWVRSCVERYLRKPAAVTVQSDCLEECSAISLQSRSIPTEEKLTTGLFHLLIPLRRTHTAESRSVEDVFPGILDVLCSRRQPRDTSIQPLEHPPSKYRRGGDSDPTEPVGSHTDDPAVLELAIISQDDILCDAYSDREDADEVMYRYYRIGWV